MFRLAIFLGIIIGTSAHAETFRIEGRKDPITITKVDRMEEGRAVMFDIYLKYAPDGLNSGKPHVIIDCFNKTGSFINEHGSDQKIEDVKIDKNKINTSTVNLLWFKYCSTARGMSKKAMKVYGKYD